MKGIWAVSAITSILILGILGPFPNQLAYAAIGDHIGSFDGTTGGGTQFSAVRGIAVDSNDRIIVADGVLNTVQIFDSTGSFLDSFNGTTGGGTKFLNPFSVTTDSIDRIIVADTNLDTVQIFEGISSCSPPASGDWTVSPSCTMTGDATADGNVIVPDGVLLTIPNGITLTIPSGSNITILSGGGILIEFGGTVIVVF